MPERRNTKTDCKDYETGKHIAMKNKYENIFFNNQVAEHNFPGYPTPKLASIFIICKSIMSWLDNDDNNIAIINC